MGNLSQLDLLPRPTRSREKLPDNLHLRRKKSLSPPRPRGSGIAWRLCQPAVLTNPASNLPHQPFPRVCELNWLRDGHREGGRSLPGEEGGRGARPPISVSCQSLNPSPWATSPCQLQAGGSLARSCQGWLWEPGQAPAHPCSCQFCGRKNWKIENIFPHRKTKKRKKKRPKQS